MLIGLMGKQRVGKDTVADYLTYKYGFIRYAFADRLKEVAHMLGWDGKKDKRGRRLLQQLGTDVAREYNPNVWVDYVTERISHHRARYPQGKTFNCVITDVRFENECDMVSNRGGHMIKILRDTGIKDSHKSECEFDHWHGAYYVIDNNSTIKAMYNRIEELLTVIKKGG